MGLVEDARRDLTEMVYSDDYTGNSWPRCRVCGLIDGEHETDCTTPKIIAALEVAEAWIVSLESNDPTHHTQVEQRLIDAVRGAEVTRER